jgi:alkylation response protein AidB-like acyl-CoA dehydrogenase
MEIARALQPRIVAERDPIEAARRLPQDLARDLARAGFLRIYLPRTYGGLDFTPMEAMEIFEELARADASVAWCVWNWNTHWTVPHLPPETVRTVHANATVIIANSMATSGIARVVDGGYRVSGRWSFVSGCQLADWMDLHCVVQAGGEPRLPPSGQPETRLLLIPAKECDIIDTWTVGGLRGTGSHDVVVTDVFVPFAFGANFNDAYTLHEPRYRIPASSRANTGLGAMALGIARSAIDAFVEIAATKTPRRAAETLRNNHGAQVRLSEAECLVRSARLFLFDSLNSLWSALIETGEVTMAARAQVRLALSHAVASAVQAVDLLYLGAGSNSLLVSCPLERAFRDVHAMTLHIGVHPRILESTGQVLFGMEPETPL